MVRYVRGGLRAEQRAEPVPYRRGLGQASGRQDVGRDERRLSGRRRQEHLGAERCGANTCIGSDLDPVLLFDPSGNLIKSFGAKTIAWPHGIHVDGDGNVWIADALGFGEQPKGWGHVVYKFSPDGELLMTLGKKGIAGDGRDTFTKPSDLFVAPNGDIFVADGHDADLNNRIVKFSSDGTFIKAWGQTGSENGEFRDPHALVMDSRGRLFVGDRGNGRIQIFDQGWKAP